LPDSKAYDKYFPSRNKIVAGQVERVVPTYCGTMVSGAGGSEAPSNFEVNHGLMNVKL